MVTTKSWTWLLLVMVGAIAAAGSTCAASTLDTVALQRTSSAAVCTVTLQNSWGIPTVVQSGFLLGDGRFLVTDLGPLAQSSSAALIVVGFADGSLAVSTQYGLAVPPMGLVMLKVEEAKVEAPKTDAAATDTAAAPTATAPAKAADKPKPDPAAADKPPVLRKGLLLAASMPTLDYSPPVAQVGWRWADDAEVLESRLSKGPTVKEFATLLKIDPPAPPPDFFFKFDGDHLEAATGSPIIDRDSKVVAMTLEMTSQKGEPMVLAMPTLAFRTMLTSGAVMPELKPLAELPKSPWPTRGLRMPGKPGIQSDLSKAQAEVTHNMTCTACNGTGRSKAGDLCTECQGEKHVVGKKLTDAVADMVELATRTLWVPSLDDRIRSTMRNAGRDMIKNLTNVGPTFETTYAMATAADLLEPRPDVPARRGPALRSQGTRQRSGRQVHPHGPLEIQHHGCREGRRHDASGRQTPDDRLRPQGPGRTGPGSRSSAPASPGLRPARPRASSSCRWNGCLSCRPRPRWPRPTCRRR